MTMQTRANLQKSSPAQRATEKTMITVPAISDQILVIWKQNFSPILPKLLKNSVRRSKMRTSNYLKKTVSNK